MITVVSGEMVHGLRNFLGKIDCGDAPRSNSCGANTMMTPIPDTRVQRMNECRDCAVKSCVLTVLLLKYVLPSKPLVVGTLSRTLSPPQTSFNSPPPRASMSYSNNTDYSLHLPPTILHCVARRVSPWRLSVSGRRQSSEWPTVSR